MVENNPPEFQEEIFTISESEFEMWGTIQASNRRMAADNQAVRDAITNGMPITKILGILFNESGQLQPKNIQPAKMILRKWREKNINPKLEKSTDNAAGFGVTVGKSIEGLKRDLV